MTKPHPHDGQPDDQPDDRRLAVDDKEQFAVFSDECATIFNRTFERGQKLWRINDGLVARCQELQKRLKQSEGTAGLPSTDSTAARDQQDEQKVDEPVIACLIDGDGAISHQSFLKQGRQGGAKFHEVLSKYIAQAAKTVLGGEQRFRIVVQIYHHRAHLSQTFVQHHVCDPREFVAGFNTVDPLSCMVDMGSGARDATRQKLAGLLGLYASMPKSHCPLIFLGAGWDPLYSLVIEDFLSCGSLPSPRPTSLPLPDLDPLRPDNDLAVEAQPTKEDEEKRSKALDRIVLLKGFTDVAPEIKSISGLRIVGFPKVFLSQRPADGTAPLPSSPPARHSRLPSTKPLASSSPHPASTSPSTETKKSPVIVGGGVAAASTTSTSTDGGRITGSGSGSGEGGGRRDIDPKRVKLETARNWQSLPQNPPPCKWHYLLGICPRTSCDFGHHYRITPDQLLTIKKIAQQNPCFNLLEYGQCNDHKCFYGHVCPYGPRCDKRGAGCKFTGEGMHD